MKVKGRDTDGSDAVIEEGQVWGDSTNGEPDIYIDEVTEERVDWHYEGEPPRSNWGDPHGSNGFIDFLETCCYELKK